MTNETRLTNPEYVSEIIELLNQNLSKKQLQDLLLITMLQILPMHWKN